MPEKSRDVLLVGIGNEFRKDDGVGCYVVGKIMSRGGGRLAAKILAREGTDLIECWRGYETVYVVDAASSGREPGTVHRFEIPGQELPKSVFCTSTHAFSLAEVIHLAKTLDALPPRVIVYGIEAGSFDHGRGLTENVQAGADKLVEELSGEINSLLIELPLNKYNFKSPISVKEFQGRFEVGKGKLNNREGRHA